MDRLKNEIIISMLNKLGIGVNAYMPDITRAYIVTSMLRKLLPDMLVSVSDKSNNNEIIISINDDFDELLVRYVIEDARVISVELLGA